MEKAAGPPGAALQGDAAAGSNDVGDMTFCMGNYIAESMKMMFTMRSHRMLTDVVLQVGGEEFHVHKLVLAAASPYFKAMFTGGLAECAAPRVALRGVCPSAMAWLVYFMYTGKVRVTELTVCQLLPAAAMFQIASVTEACCAFLERQLDPSNAIGIAAFAEQHGCAGLKLTANQYIERHFTEVSKEEEFLQLSAERLIALVRRDELNVREERDVYNAVLNWVKHAEAARAAQMEHILRAVRCQYLTPRFLRQQMTTCRVLRRAPACREYLHRIFQDLTLHKRPAVTERRPNAPRVILVAGGYLLHSIAAVDAYSVDERAWTPLPRLTVPRSGLGAVFLKGLFYAVGGRNNSPGSSYDSDWVDVYNPTTEHWQPCNPMLHPRHRVGVAVMDGLLYAVGGSAGSEYHKSVECYDPDTDRWSPVAPMSAARLGVGVAALDRLLYAVGGFDGARRLPSAERYHPEDDQWTRLPDMQHARSGAGVCALGGHVYAVGGYDGAAQLASVERYSPERAAWAPVAPLGVARSALAVAVIDDRIYAMGGYDGMSFLDIVEIYDPTSDSWSPGAPMPSGRSGHAAAVSRAPPPRRRPPAGAGAGAGAAGGGGGGDVPRADCIVGTISHGAG